MELEEKKELIETETETEEPKQAEKEVTEALISEQGVAGDRFDTFPPTGSAEESEEEEIDDRDCASVTYGFKPEEIKKALQIFQKNTIYKKNMIYSLIIGILFLIYLYRIIQTGETGGFNLFMCVIIIVAIGYIWYFPLAHIKNVVKAISQTEYREDFILKVYEDSIQAGVGKEKTVFRFDEGKIRVWETEEMFVVGHGKERVFAVPKRCVDTKEDCEKITAFFQKGLGDKYYYLDQK